MCGSSGLGTVETGWRFRRHPTETPKNLLQGPLDLKDVLPNKGQFLKDALLGGFRRLLRIWHNTPQATSFRRMESPLSEMCSSLGKRSSHKQKW